MKFFRLKFNSARAQSEQTFWDLTCIQGSSFGLAWLLLSINLTKKFGASTTLISMLIANLITWVISLAVIDMMYHSRKEHKKTNPKNKTKHKFNSAIENIRENMGLAPYFVASWIVIIAFTIWNALQLRNNVELISNFKYFSELSQLRIGVLFGVLVSLIAMGGIYIIRNLSIIVFPLLLTSILFSIFFIFPPPIFQRHFDFSFEAIILLVLIELPGTINLPTFFRHSKSIKDSFKAIKIIPIYLTIYGILGIWIGSSNPYPYFQNLLNKTSVEIIVTAIILISLVMVYLINIYFASAAWDALSAISHKMINLIHRLTNKTFLKKIYPSRKTKNNHFEEEKKFAIIGMFGIILFVYFQNSRSLILVEQLMDSYLVTLCVVMFLYFLSTKSLKNIMKFRAEYISLASWSIGCIVASIVSIQQTDFSSKPHITGISSSTLVYLLLIFILGRSKTHKKTP